MLPLAFVATFAVVVCFALRSWFCMVRLLYKVASRHAFTPCTQRRSVDALDALLFASVVQHYEDQTLTRQVKDSAPIVIIVDLSVLDTNAGSGFNPFSSNDRELVPLPKNTLGRLFVLLPFW